MLKISEKKKYTSEEYLAMSDLEGRYELVSGELYDMSPAPNFMHQRLVTRISGIIFNYIAGNGGNCEVITAPSDVRLDDENTVQPDLFVVCDPSKFNEHGCVGAPDWVIEVLSPSNSNHDTVKKYELYLKAGVREYWIVDPMYERVLVNTFENGSPTRIYTFDDEIPAYIYRDAENPLSIRIKDICCVTANS